VVAVNLSANPVSVAISLKSTGTALKVIQGYGNPVRTDDKISCSLPAYGIEILKVN
jgi:hypothetical protein